MAAAGEFSKQEQANAEGGSWDSRLLHAKDTLVPHFMAARRGTALGQPREETTSLSPSDDHLDAALLLVPSKGCRLPQSSQLVTRFT